jgi:hypothetical protein
MCGASLFNGHIYGVGGYTPYVDAISRVEWLHPGSKIRFWEEVASFNHARRAFEVFTIENRVNVFGGISESNDIDVHVTSCEMYCPINNEWTMIAPMTTLRLRFSLCIIRSHQSLYDGEETNLVEIYDTETNSWIAGDPHSTKTQEID